MLLCFFRNVAGLVFVSLAPLNPQKLFFFIFALSVGFGNPLLKNELWDAAGRCPFGCKYDPWFADGTCMGAFAGR